MARPCAHPTGEPQPGKCAVCRRYVESAAHRAYYDSLVLPAKGGTPTGGVRASRPRQPSRAGGGPGSELRSLLGLLGFRACQECADLAREMDRWGVEGCRLPENEAVILARLREKAKEASFLSKVKAGLLGALRGVVVDPRDPAPGLLAEAIRRHEAGRAESAAPWRWVSTAELISATVTKLLPRLPPGLSGVCGVTRSGMLPATALATHLHLPLYAVSQHAGEPQPLGGGSRGTLGTPGGPLLVVDDTVYSGSAMAPLRRRLGTEGRLYAAVFARPGREAACDFVGEELASPHLLEWNLMNGGPLAGRATNPAMQGGVALDFDGVICADPAVSEAADPAGYAAWLADARPLLLPRRLPARLVITARLARHREATLAWCARWGVKAERLEMWPGGDPRERDRADVGAWKAGVYKASGCSLYVESDAGLAWRVAELSGKPVACPAAGRVFQAGLPGPG